MVAFGKVEMGLIEIIRLEIGGVKWLFLGFMVQVR